MKYFVVFILAILGTASSSATPTPTTSSTSYEVPKNEDYVCTVEGWNSATGEFATIRIYLQHTPCNDIYIGREVDEDGVSSLYGVVKFVTNPKYEKRYKYFVKTGLVGGFFFNSRKLQAQYVRTW